MHSGKGLRSVPGAFWSASASSGNGGRSGRLDGQERNHQPHARSFFAILFPPERDRSCSSGPGALRGARPGRHSSYACGISRRAPRSARLRISEAPRPASSTARRIRLLRVRRARRALLPVRVQLRRSPGSRGYVCLLIAPPRLDSGGAPRLSEPTLRLISPRSSSAPPLVHRSRPLSGDRLVLASFSLCSSTAPITTC